MSEHTNSLLRIRALELASRVEKLTAENAKLREQLEEAVRVLNDMHTEMAIVCNAGFDPDRWAERMSALNKAGDVLNKHLELIA
jgi:hypothetical protein